VSEFLNDAGEPQIIRRALEMIDATRKVVVDWTPTAHAAIRAIEASRAEGIDWRLQCGYSSGSLNGVLIIADDVTDLKLVLPLLRALRREGYRVNRYEDWQELPSRTYYFDALNESEPKGPIIVRAFFPWDAEKAAEATCKFVQTGTKEVPVMEVVCGGEKTPELTQEVTA